MNCSNAQQLIAVERDQALSADLRRSLEAHLLTCAGCRQAHGAMESSLERWRKSTALVPLPEVERAWQDIRRETQRGKRPPAESPHSSPHRWRWALPLGAAAALALLTSVIPRSASNKVEAAQPNHREIAQADFVEVPNDASSIVYVDDQSGWLVVWSVSDAQPGGG